MSDLIDVLYRLRNMAAASAESLRESIKDAQAVLDRLDKFADDAEDVAELSCASDLFPSARANIPERSGLVRAVGVSSVVQEGSPTDE